ncbi:peptidoglycan-recognition protein SB1-like [Ischnura elegans]|uniref:peptidoglycan-recognition protein SB1-like n=1 Tax=Ischnura elegans TaxID=197161 RepID=UPI001ED89F99|nr:peptidoglycan-recognition protein SB1-like [Ischnura elegans]
MLAMQSLRITFALLAVVLILRDAEGCPDIIRRSQWGATPPSSVTAMRSPVEYVIIHHTVTSTCSSLATCSRILRTIQTDHKGRRYDDIGYTFLVSSDGKVYEGRGWDKVGAHAPSYNDRSIGISFIGNFQTERPTQQQQNAAKSLISCAVSLGKIGANYKLLGHRQTKATECPGITLFNIIKTWPRWQSSP